MRPGSSPRRCACSTSSSRGSTSSSRATWSKRVRVSMYQGARATAILRVITHSSEPAPRLIWIYAIGIGAFQGMNAILALFLAARFGVTRDTIGYFFTYIGVHLGPDARADPRTGGRSIRRGAAVAHRSGAAGDRAGGDAVHASHERSGRVCREARRLLAGVGGRTACRSCRSRWRSRCCRSERRSRSRA